ncbi:uncharacterized protein LOC123530176 [Mercenaria mercenaria]|uniref:uncharacterized protein LOC123530176 n=1 Tax=Mercenaria mercenaria TaxID=6596 RepID=UPI00234F036F|nr:uncharacterized protein LOC123530176 [Mercenaria mercenaria]
MPIIRLLIVFLVYKSVLSSVNGNNSNSENDSKVLQMLIDCGGNVASLRNELQDMKDKLERLRSETATDTYIRWGRSSCPSGAANVYDGFVAGSYYSHSGAAANYICQKSQIQFSLLKSSLRQLYIRSTKLPEVFGTISMTMRFYVPFVTFRVAVSSWFLEETTVLKILK